MKLRIEITKDPKELAQLNKAVQMLHHELFPSEFKAYDAELVEKACTKMLFQQDTYAFVARIEDEAVGYLLCFVKDRADNEFQFAKQVLEIDQISVEEAYRNMGIAQQLMDRAVSLAREKGIPALQLNHWEGNTEAREFFSKNGFRNFNYRMKRNG